MERVIEQAHRANCGCQWTCKSENGIFVLSEARKHIQDTGHGVEIVGTMRATEKKSRFLGKSFKGALRNFKAEV